MLTEMWGFNLLSDSSENKDMLNILVRPEVDIVQYPPLASN